jgi:PAS domain S-box-containing protein
MDDTMNPMVVMAGSYNYLLVVLSALIAVLASYSALNLAERITAARGMVRLAWLISGSAAMGIGIWSMHYTAMLGFQLPVPVWYHWPTVLLSLLAAVAASAIALFTVSRTTLGWPAGLTGSVLQGAGIAGLHYIAMAAMRLAGMCHYSPPMVALSVLVAIAGSLLSLWLTFCVRDQVTGRRRRMAASALLMGAAICIMHYTGMAAATFTASTEVPDLSYSVRVTALAIAAIITVTVMILVATLVTALVDRLQERTALLNELFEQGPQAVALLNRDNQVVRLNREFTRVFEYTPQEALGRRLTDLIVPGEAIDEVQGHLESISHGQRVDGEAVRQRKNGSRLHVLLVAVPLSVPGGEIKACVMYSDITERKAAEVSLQALSSRLMEVQETERQHLARELHAEIGQLLTGLRLLLRPGGEAPAEEIRSRFEQAQTIVDDLLGRIRRLSFDLRPADLDQFGLLPALLALFERYTAQTGVLVDFKHQKMARRLAPQVETAAYRVVQEALTNTARHAGVAGLAVRIWVHAGKLNLQVEDRGCGFDPEATLKAPRSSGLIGMRERISLLGGSMTIESSQGAGTTITAELPVDETAAT